MNRDGTREIQVTCGLVIVLPRLSFPVTVKVSVSLRRLNFGFAGATLSESSLKRTTTCAVPSAEPPPAPLLASIVAVPSLTARTTPESPAALAIWVTPVARLCHTSAGLVMTALLASRTTARRVFWALSVLSVLSAGFTATVAAACTTSTVTLSAAASSVPRTFVEPFAIAVTRPPELTVATVWSAGVHVVVCVAIRLSRASKAESLSWRVAMRLVSRSVDGTGTRRTARWRTTASALSLTPPRPTATTKTLA